MHIEWGKSDCNWDLSWSSWHNSSDISLTGWNTNCFFSVKHLNLYITCAGKQIYILSGSIGKLVKVNTMVSFLVPLTLTSIATRRQHMTLWLVHSSEASFYTCILHISRWWSNRQDIFNQMIVLSPTRDVHLYKDNNGDEWIEWSSKTKLMGI